MNANQSLEDIVKVHWLCGKAMIYEPKPVEVAFQPEWLTVNEAGEAVITGQGERISYQIRRGHDDVPMPFLDSFYIQFDSEEDLALFMAAV